MAMWLLHKKVVSLLTGVEPGNVEAIRNYYKDPWRYSREDHPFPIELCPGKVSPLLDGSYHAQGRLEDYRKDHRRDDSSGTSEERWHVRDKPDPIITSGFNPTQRQFVYLARLLLGFDPRKDDMNFSVRFGMVEPGARQAGAEYIHYDSVPEDRNITFAFCNISAVSTEFAQLTPAIIKKYPLLDPNRNAFPQEQAELLVDLQRGKLLTTPRAGWIYAFDGALALHMAGRAESEKPSYRCFASATMRPAVL